MNHVSFFFQKLHNLFILSGFRTDNDDSASMCSFSPRGINVLVPCLRAENEIQSAFSVVRVISLFYIELN